MSAYIEFQDVKKVYQMGEVSIEALAGVDFAIDKGEFVVIAGASGAGKSTILNILGGMDSATSGTIIVDGNRVSDYTPKQLTTYRRYDIGFVFQFYNLVQNLTVKENVELATQICSSGWRSPVPWPRIQSCCFAMSRPELWTIRPASRSSSCCRTPAGKEASASSSSHIISL